MAKVEVAAVAGLSLVEAQIGHQKTWPQRMLYYWAKMYAPVDGRRKGCGFYAVRETGGFSSGPKTDARLRADLLVFARIGKIVAEETSFVGYIEQLLWSHQQAYPLIEATEIWYG